jgi:hypothetical protein
LITLPVSALRRGGGPRGFEQTSQLLLPVARCNGFQRFKRSIPFSGSSPMPRRPRCSGHKRDLRDPSPAPLDGCNGLRTRSLNDPAGGRIGRRGYVPVTQLKRKERCDGFRQSRRMNSGTIDTGRRHCRGFRVGDPVETKRAAHRFSAIKMRSLNDARQCLSAPEPSHR